ncbi:MAG: pimeloyl-ACP methyl ester carboxylesterase [Paracoccaceae bacterium]|jgi:pimeloyl-ACP methyl ester carboxylesterase
MYELVKFSSEGVDLRGRFYRLASAHRAPCIIMAHGTTATISMVAEDYAAAFHRAGMSVLLYDHINFGSSGGVMRQEINPWVQARGYRDAVAYIRQRSDVDPDRIAIWGDSFSAMEVLVVGALIEGLAGIVAQIPVCGIELPNINPSTEIFDLLKKTFERGDVSGTPETTEGPMPVVSFDQVGSPSLLKPIQAFKWFIEYVGRYDSEWLNIVTRVMPLTEVPFSPYLTAPFITAPTLMMAGRNDEMVHCNPVVQQAVFDKIIARKEFYEIEGGHFGLLYSPSKTFDEAAARQIKFLTGLFEI